MNFERTHLVVTYLLVGTGFLVLFLSGEMSPAFWMVFTPLILLSVRYGQTPRLQSAAMWNSILLAGLGVLAAIAVSTGDWLRYSVWFASMMVVAKLYQRRGSRDWFQLYVLSFLQLVAGAVVNPTLSFAFCFLLYVVFITWALVLLHLRRDMERLAELEASADGIPDGPVLSSYRMRRLISPRFLAGTSALALGLFAFSVLVFLFFPRLGLGFFGQHRRTGTQVSGFSDSIELGGFGRLKKDQTIVMRVELDGDTKALLPLRMKGIAFDTYDGTTWSKRPSSRRQWQLPRILDDGFIAVRKREDPPQGATEITMRVFMEHLNIDRKTVFGEPYVMAVRDLQSDRYVFDYRKRTRFYIDGNDDLLFESKRSAPLRYEIRSLRVPRDAERLRESGSDTPEWVREYLPLPVLDPRVKALADRITSGLSTDMDRALAIEKYLLQNYKYSLDGGHSSESPLVDFLFGLREGHCEFFSTAFVVLARAVGIPARPVGGFYGGVYNEVGDYVVLRQADAHSWAEVWFSSIGEWVAFDATPPGGALAAAPEDGVFTQLSRAVDSLQLLWYKWVIRWDLERQLAFLRGIGKRLKGVGDILPQTRGGDRSMGGLVDALKARLVPIIGICLSILFVVLWVIGRRRGWFVSDARRSAHGKRNARDDARRRKIRALYIRLLQYAERQGLSITPSTTPRRLLVMLTDAEPRCVESARELIQSYEAVVFGSEVPTERIVERCKKGYKRVTALRFGSGSA